MKELILAIVCIVLGFGFGVSATHDYVRDQRLEWYRKGSLDARDTVVAAIREQKR